MARGKKKESALTPEEKLAQALVPLDEQLYQIPENWCWTTVGNMCSFVGGGTPDKSNPEYWDGDIPWASVKDIKGSKLYDTVDRITQAGLEHSASNLCQKGELILVTRIEPGKAIVSDIITAINQDLKVVKSQLNASFLFYYFQTFQHKFEEKASGSTVKGITIPNVQGTVFPLPPLSEQQRIVDRIEYLFAKLDEAKEKAQSVLDSFETRKAAILRNAFRGEYTSGSSVENIHSILSCMLSTKENMIRSKQIQRAKVKAWSDEDTIRVFPSEWEQVRVGEIAFVTKLAGFEYTKYIHLEETGEVPVVRAQNVRMGYLSTENLLYIDNETSETLSRSALTKECILVTFIGAGIGDVCIFDQKCRFHLAPNVAKVEFFCGGNEELNTKYALYYLLSPYGQHEIFKNMKATAQPSLSMETIRDIIIPIPDKEEQAEIVRILDSLLAKEQQAKEAAESVLEKIDLLKKSILARAFRGELGTNDAGEESAIVLLKTII